MIKKILIFLFAAVSVSFLVYLALPAPSFPEPPSGFLQSGQPADVETPLRRGYYTDMTRQEIISHYQKQFGWGYRLNYPPEEGQTIIRDQTKSSFLEEIVHPFRESIFINGYEPKENENALEVDGRRWKEKVIVKYVPSSHFVRILMGTLSLGLVYLLFREI